MSKFSKLKNIKKLYSEGINIMEYLRNDLETNSTEAIMISYDLQAGSYIRAAEANQDFLIKYVDAICKIFTGFGKINSVMEAGIGEATLMSALMKKFDLGNRIKKLGFDISWSRVKYAKKHSLSNGVDIDLFTADMFNIPLPDNSVDIVYTSHSLEPNGGREKEALSELFRVAAKYVVLLEPGYGYACSEGKKRMKRHGYVTNLDIHANELGYEVILHRQFDHSINLLNPTAITILKKAGESHSSGFICPVTHTDLKMLKGVLYGVEGLFVYPIIDGIPCLLAENAILASHFNS